MVQPSFVLDAIRVNRPLTHTDSPIRYRSLPIDVSICIANWNCVEMLHACLESLLDQPQGVELEVIVVDNASSDGAADMVARHYPEVTLIRNATNRGFARANNQAAALARGRYLLFLNNDTVVPAGTLRGLVDFLEANPTVGMVGPCLRGSDGQPQISYRQRPTLAALLHRTTLLRWTGLFRRAYYHYRRQHFDPSTLRSVEALMGAAVVLPRDVFFACGQWDEDFDFGGEDLDLSARVAKQHGVVFLPEVEITHYGRVSSRQNVNFASPGVAVGYVQYFRKHGYSPWLLTVYKLLVTLDAPLQCGVKLMQALWRLATGRPSKAYKSWLAARGLLSLMATGLSRLWRA